MSPLQLDETKKIEVFHRCRHITVPQTSHDFESWHSGIGPNECPAMAKIIKAPFLKPSSLIFLDKKCGDDSHRLNTLPFPFLFSRHSGMGILLEVKLLVRRVIKSPSISSYLKRIASITRQPVSATKSMSKISSGVYTAFTA